MIRFIGPAGFLLLLGIVLVGGRSPARSNPAATPDTPAVAAATTAEPYTGPLHVVRAYDPDRFHEGIIAADGSFTPPAYTVSGGIVPHHLFPGHMLADFYKRLAVQQPQTVVVIGPNHAEAGTDHIQTSLYGWQTPFGIVEPDTETIMALLAAGMAGVNEISLPADHAVAGALPFLRFYTPGTRIVPLLISGRTTIEESRALAAGLHRLLPAGTPVVAAVDFSHYLNSREAQEKDNMTLSIMQQFDYRRLYTLNNDYTDSPPSLGILLMLMQLRHTTAWDVLANTNSGLLQGNDTVMTTSYFSVLLH